MIDIAQSGLLCPVFVRSLVRWFVGHKNPTLPHFFLCPSFPAMSIFSFSNPIDGSVSPEQISCQNFPLRFSAIERFGPRFSSHDLRLPKSRLAMQSSQIRTVRVHYADKLLESIEYDQFWGLGKIFLRERMEMIIIGQGYSVLLLCLRLE